MNVNDLDTFNQVVLHRGITRASRHMPQRVTASAVNKAMARLEAAVGEPLFDRAPFRLRPRGEQLSGLVHPFFTALEQFLATNGRIRLHIAASEVVLNTYLADIIVLLERRCQATQLRLRSASQSQMHAWLRDGSVDLVIAPPASPRDPNLQTRPLARVPLALVVPKRGALKTARDLWSGPQPNEPLIVPGGSETITEQFARGLKARRITWDVGVDASSLHAVTSMVAEGRGVGLVVAEPSLTQRKPLHMIPLPDFPLVEVAATWHRTAHAGVTLLVDVLHERAAQNWPKTT